MADEALRRPRRKPKAGLHLLESPYPIPIETITGKEAEDARWYYYFGTLVGNCISVSRIGDLTFLYRLGFFGKGILSKSRPQFEKYTDVLSEHSRKQYSYKLSLLEPEIRKKYMKKYDITVKERLRQHESWSITKAKLEKAQKEKKIELETKVKEETRLPQCEDLHTFIDDGIVEEYSTDGEEDESLVPLETEISEKGDEEQSNKHQEFEVKEEIFDNCEDKDEEQNIKHQEFEVQKEIFDNSDNKDSSSYKNKLKRSHSMEEISQNTDKTAKLDDPYKLYESLSLTFEEAFFLSYGLGCLAVTPDGQDDAMNLLSMWETFCQRNSRFVQLYVAYHYFRSKGWVVRMGNMYGADFALYKEGMPFFHASYCVYVNLISEEELQVSDNANLTWNNLSCMSRVNEKVAKEVLMCYVIKPKGLKEEDLKKISCIRQFRVMEVVLRRWIPEKHREIKQKR